MNECKIFFSENDELAEFEMQGKCWRGDIIVKFGEKLFKPTVITPERLFIDFNNSIEGGQIFEIDENIILVKQTDRETIINILIKLTEIGYFAIKNPVDFKKAVAYYPQELQDLKNWVQVY